MIYSVVLRYCYSDLRKTWEQEYLFYQGDLTNTNFSNDWRFKEVTERGEYGGLRKQCEFKGLVETTFPIKYPLKTNLFVLEELPKINQKEE